MTTFKFRLAKVHKLRENTREERRRQLAEARGIASRLESQIADLQQQAQTMRNLRRPEVGNVNVDRLLELARYEAVLQMEVAAVEKQLADVRQEVERRIEALKIADQEVKVLENLREKRWNEFQQSQARADAKATDEFASRRLAFEELN